MNNQLLDAYIPTPLPPGADVVPVYNGGITNAVAEMEALGGRTWIDMRRPFRDRNGRPALTINLGRTTLNRGEQVPIREHILIRDWVDRTGQMLPVHNATTLRKEEWIELDRKVLLAARYRLRAWKDLADRNPFGGFNAMGKTILETEMMSDPGEAVVDMDGITDGRGDTPKFTGAGLPLPITHSDFYYSQRQLYQSRNGSTPLDMTMGEAAGRRVAEAIEKTTIGVKTGITYGGVNTALTYVNTPPVVYGYTNFPQRLTKTNLATPTATTLAATLADVLNMRDHLKAAKMFGPYMIYHSNDWDQWMDNDYILTGGNVTTETLRNRLKAIDDVEDVRRLDFLFGSTTDINSHDITNIVTYGPGGDVDVTLKPYTLLMIDMRPETARAVDGMPITTVQWESKGGLQLSFKVMCIQVPQLRADYYGNTGVMHATTS